MVWLELLIVVCIVLVAAALIPRAEPFCVQTPNTRGAIMEDSWDNEQREGLSGLVHDDGMISLRNLPLDTGSVFISR